MTDPLTHFYTIEPFNRKKVRNYKVGSKYAIIELISGEYGVVGLGNQKIENTIPTHIDLQNISHKYLYACYLNAVFNNKFKSLNESSFIDNISPEKYNCIVMIGLFRPILERYKKLNIRPVVFDFQKDEPGLYNINEQKSWLAKADLVIMTGTVIVNQTFLQLIEWINPETQLVIAGPSTLLHNYMFTYFKNTVLSGMIFEPDQPDLVKCISNGMGTKDFKKFGKKIDVFPV